MEKSYVAQEKSGNPHSALQILSAYLTESSVVLVQETIHEKNNERPAFQQMLTYLDVHGKIITADAMHCQRRISEEIVAHKENYVFGLRENQPSPLADVRMYFEDTDDSDGFDAFQTIEKNAGRIEKKICRKTQDTAWPAAHKWPGLKSVFAVERMVDVRGSIIVPIHQPENCWEQSVNTGKSNPCIGFWMLTFQKMSHVFSAKMHMQP